MMPDAQELYEVTDRTWPPARWIDTPAFSLREGMGGGQRVSSATAKAAVTALDIRAAESGMRDLGQAPIFMIREGDADLDRQLADMGYAVHDPVNLYACDIDLLAAEPVRRMTAFALWEPLAIQRELWARGGIGAGRIEVMMRAPQPKTTILARCEDQPAGTAYCGIHDGVAMIHAIETVPHHRRKGVAGRMIRCAAIWAGAQGAAHFALVTTQANAGANGLYSSLGMNLVGQYHYRKQKDPK